MGMPFKERCQRDAPQITPDVYSNSLKITVHSNKCIYIENYKNISRCTENQITVRCKNMNLIVCGNCLKVDYYCREEIKIYGRIEKILYEMN